MAAPAILSASRAMGQDAVFKIGYVSPQTGPLAGFGESDAFALEATKAAFAGLQNNGAPVDVEIIVKDTQSSPNRASEVTAQLIESDGVNLVIAQGAPETTNPVADQCELSEMPCVTTMCPWQPYFFGRSGDPAVGFDYTYHYFWGLEDVIANFLDLWDASGVSGKNIAGLFPNDADGNAWGDPELGLPKPLLDRGYTVIDPGRYQVMNNDFSSQIAAFKAAGCEIVTGNMIPPDFATFWAQAKQQGFNPKVVTIGKALLFPSFLESLDAAGDGLSTEIWWSAAHPFKSSLTGQSCKELADAYTAASGKPWTQIVGYSHSIFEVAADIVKRAAVLDDSEAVLEAVRTTDLETIVGHVKFGGEGPFKNVVRTPLVAGQWQNDDAGKPQLVITSNKQAPDIPVGGEFKLIGA
ncbi:MAG: ABC transporter substrate-binding protein [Rhodobacterales bacterium]|nr:ABC transporter substrate-binding protein [Rhodobacterales bacterium]